MKKDILWSICILFSVVLSACGDSAQTNDNGATLTFIAVAPASPSLVVGVSQQFIATGTYSDDSTQDITASVTWTSSDTSKANISNAGIATAVAAGTTTIKAMSGSIEGSAALTITAQIPALVSIAVTPADPTVAVGVTQQFTATGTYTDSSTQNITGSVTWSSSDISKATISNTGLATAVAAGTTTIAAVSGVVSGATTLTVVETIPTYSISGTVTSSGAGLQGVAMTLSGAASGSVTTDANGNYLLSGLTNGSYTVTPLMSGMTFTPDSRSVTVSGADATGQDFTASIFTSGPSWSMLKLPDTGQTKHFSTVFGDDADYTLNPPAYADNGNGTITDNVTTLMWQKQDDATSRDWTAAGTYCDGLSLGGYSDWRLPNVIELMSIAVYGEDNPAIDASNFANTQSASGFSCYWSTDITPYGDEFAWYVNFFAGTAGDGSKTYNCYVRCARGGQSGAGSQAAFTDTGDGAILDGRTGLVWQKQDDAAKRNWENAITYCEGLTLAGNSDWRMPNIKELRTIVDITKYDPAIDTALFPNTQYSQVPYAESNYWSSSTDLSNTSYAWRVDFSYGGAYSDQKTGDNYIRCVQGGK